MPLPLPVTRERLDVLCKKHGTPLQLYDEDAIRSNAAGLIATMTAEFPGFKQFFCR